MSIPFLAITLALLAPAAQRDPNAVSAGRLIVEPPTLINLGFEWEIDGDANRDAAVEVRYREAGGGEWKEALQLLRIGGRTRIPRTGTPRLHSARPLRGQHPGPRARYGVRVQVHHERPAGC